MKDRVISMSEFNSEPKLTTKQSLELVRQEMKDLMELNTLLAKITRQKYLDLVKEGFKPEEALYLCKA